VTTLIEVVVGLMISLPFVVWIPIAIGVKLGVLDAIKDRQFKAFVDKYVEILTDANLKSTKQAEGLLREIQVSLDQIKTQLAAAAKTDIRVEVSGSLVRPPGWDKSRKLFDEAVKAFEAAINTYRFFLEPRVISMFTDNSGNIITTIRVVVVIPRDGNAEHKATLTDMLRVNGFTAHDFSSN